VHSSSPARLGSTAAQELGPSKDPVSDAPGLGSPATRHQSLAPDPGVDLFIASVPFSSLPAVHAGGKIQRHQLLLALGLCNNNKGEHYHHQNDLIPDFVMAFVTLVFTRMALFAMVCMLSLMNL
jgi:hypothetical protein